MIRMEIQCEVLQKLKIHASINSQIHKMQISKEITIAVLKEGIIIGISTNRTDKEIFIHGMEMTNEVMKINQLD